MGVRTIDETELREQAVVRLKKKGDFKIHLLAYVLVNGSLAGIWAMTGTTFFWPIFPILFWGIGLIFNAWDVYRRQEPSEHEIRREMEHLRAQG